LKHSISASIFIGACLFALSCLAADPTPPMMHKPDPKRVADFEACQKEAGLPQPSQDQMAKAHECMMKKKPTSAPPTGDKMAFIKAQMEARQACDTEAGIKPPSKEQISAVHDCMAKKGYDTYKAPTK
jgi:hypothetical protein